MHPFKTIPLLLAAVVTATAAPKVALVRVTDIYASLPSTVAQQTEIQRERGEIMKNERADNLLKIIAELQALQGQISNKQNGPDEETARKLIRTYELKRQEAQTLQEEFDGFKAEQEQLINRKMVSGMRESLDRIVETAAKLARERGYDAVFDSSGNTNTELPFVLYSKESPDLTEEVQAALKESEAPITPVTAD